LEFPACDASTVQVPTDTNETVDPTTVQIVPVPEEKETASPLVAEAATAYVAPPTRAVGATDEKLTD
jgi:hypothetical protein